MASLKDLLMVIAQGAKSGLIDLEKLDFSWRGSSGDSTEDRKKRFLEGIRHIGNSFAKKTNGWFAAATVTSKKINKKPETKRERKVAPGVRIASSNIALKSITGKKATIPKGVKYRITKTSKGHKVYRWGKKSLTVK